MTISSETRKAGPYTGNGVATSFAFSFKVFAKTDIKVTLLEISSGDETVPVLDSDYSVTLNADQNADPGGSVTYPISGTALASTHKLTISSIVERLQETDITNGGGFYPQVIEDALDRSTILVQQDREILDRSIRYPVSDPSLGVELPAAAQRALKSIKFDASGNVIPTTYDPDTQVATAAAYAAAAAASATSAAAAMFGFRDVVFITFANSPYTISLSQVNKLISVDTSGGAVVVNLPQISTMTLPSNVGVKKTTGDSNSVTINRAGTDLFDDGSTSYMISGIGGVALIPDTDPAPDKWSVAQFGAGAGQRQKQQFLAGVGFTAGVSTTITITETPIPTAKDAIQIHFDGGYQQESEWSYVAATGVVTFTAVIPGGTSKIEVEWISPLAIGTPADGTVSNTKLAYSAVNSQTAETAPAVDDEVLLGDTSEGALNKMTLANLLKVINALTQDSSPVKGSDFGLTYDASASAVKKVLLQDFPLPQMHINGLTWAISAGDTTNDIDIATGTCRDSTDAVNLFLTSSLTKQLDANWAVGTNQGGLDTGAVGNNEYYIWLIKRSDTGVVDALFSLSATAPTMPTNYDFKRLIGWVKRVAAANVSMHTYELSGGGIELLFDSPTLDVDLANTLTSTARTDALKVPTSFSVHAMINAMISDAGATMDVYLSCPDNTDMATSSVAAPLDTIRLSSTTITPTGYRLTIRTSASGTIRARASSATVDNYRVVTLGFQWARHN